MQRIIIIHKKKMEKNPVFSSFSRSASELVEGAIASAGFYLGGRALQGAKADLKSVPFSLESYVAIHQK